MKEKMMLIGAAIVGILVGFLSTYPLALDILPSLIFWALAGIIVGLFIRGKKIVVWAGILYGIFLTITFLFSRFGGTPDKILGYSLFVIGMCIPGLIAGIVTVWIGSKIRGFTKKS